MHPHTLHTIGYSGFSLEEFLCVLKERSIGALVDVRSSPYSSRFKDFNSSDIKYRLNENNIYYLFLGEQLGARPKDTTLYTNGFVDFSKIAASDAFIHGCSRIREGLNQLTVCLMCAEKDPATCHRAILVAHTLRILYPEINIAHIRSLTNIETQDALDRRIMALYGLEQEHFYKNSGERLREAYALRSKENDPPRGIKGFVARIQSLSLVSMK